MKLTEDQQALLERLANADTIYKQAALTEYEKARDLAEKRVLGFKIDRDKLAAEAARSGISLRKISHIGLHTQHTPTAKEAIAHGMSLAEPVAVAAKPAAREGNFLWDQASSTLDIALTAVDFEPYAQFLHEVSEEARHVFVVEGDALRPADPDSDETWLNPVVQVVTAPDGKWREKALAYVREQGAA